MPRSTTPWISYLRIGIGLLWLFELLLGRWWRFGLTEGAHPAWVGEEAGQGLTQFLEGVLERGTTPLMEPIINQVLLPHAEAWSIALVALECAFVVSFIFGLFVRPVALLGFVAALIIMGAGVTRIYALFAVGHLVLLWTGGGHALSFDGLIIRNLRFSANPLARGLRRLVQLRIVPRSALLVIASGALLAALYLVMQVIRGDDEALAIVRMDVAALLGLLAMGVFVGQGLPAGSLSVPIDLLRIFVGLKFVQEIFVWTSVDRHGLPGWASPGELGAMLESVAEHHWEPIAECINTAVLPHIELWAAGLAIVQTLVAVALLLGWRSRTAAVVGTLLVLALLVLGFARVAPIMLVYLIFLVGAGSGRVIALDATPVGGRGTLLPLPWPRWAGIVTAAAAAALIWLADQELGGVVTAGYEQTLPGLIAVLLALPLIALTLAAWFQPRQT